MISQPISKRNRKTADASAEIDFFTPFSSDFSFRLQSAIQNESKQLR